MNTEEKKMAPSAPVQTTETHNYGPPPPPYSQQDPSYPVLQKDVNMLQGGINTALAQPAPPPVLQTAVQQPAPPTVLQTIVQMAPTTQVTVLGPYPTRTNCPHCRADISTSVSSSVSCCGYLSCLALCLFGCIPCCCIPCCMDSCKVFAHRCPNCKAFIGKYSQR